MVVKLYASEYSPPCRAVWMALETLGLQYEFIETNALKLQNRTPEYEKVILLIHMADPVTTVSAFYFHTFCPSVRPFRTIEKKPVFQVEIIL